MDPNFLTLTLHLLGLETLIAFKANNIEFELDPTNNKFKLKLNTISEISTL
jgi:hypothetical protein